MFGAFLILDRGADYLAQESALDFCVAYFTAILEFHILEVARKYIKYSVESIC